MRKFILFILSWLWGGVFFYLFFNLFIQQVFTVEKKDVLIRAAGLLLVGLVILLKLLIRSGWRSADFWSLSVPVVMFQLAAVIFILFLEGDTTKIIFLAISALALSFYLYSLWLFYFYPEKYQAFTLLNLSWYLQIVSLFMLAVAWFGLMVIIHFSVYYLLLVETVFLGIIFTQLWYMYKLEFNKKFWQFLLISVLIGGQTLLVVSFLPISFFVLGFLFVEFVYLLLQTIFDLINHSFSEKRFFYLTGGIFILTVFLLFTTRWL